MTNDNIKEEKKTLFNSYNLLQATAITCKKISEKNIEFQMMISRYSSKEESMPLISKP